MTTSYARLHAHAAVALLATGFLPGPVFGQQAWRAPAPPYTVADTTGRPVPDFAWVTDSVGGVLGLPPLRSVSLPPGWREARMWMGFGIVIPETLVRVVAAPGQVTGQLVYWWESWGPLDADSGLASFRQDIRRVAGGFGCDAAPSGHTRIYHRREGRDTVAGWIEACRADFGPDEPDWVAVLDRLVAAHVFSLPDATTPTPSVFGVLDGVTLQVEALEGGRYRTLPWGQSWPEAGDEAAVMDLVRELEPPLTLESQAVEPQPEPRPPPEPESECPPEPPLPPVVFTVNPVRGPSATPYVHIVGTVVQADTALPVPGARVAWSQRSGGDSIQVDEGGGFRIRVHADEPVTLAIGSLGFRIRRDTLHVSPGTEVSARFPMVFAILDGCGFGRVIR